MREILLSRAGRRVGMASVAAYGILLTLGLARFVTRDPHPMTPKIGELRSSKQLVNVASMKNGGRVRVSSWHAHRNHHPLYAIDGMSEPRKFAKWASAEGDRDPQIEIWFERSVDLEEVLLQFASPYEGKYDMRAFTVTCLRGTPDSPETSAKREIRKNKSPKLRVTLACVEAAGLRLTFPVARFGNPTLARLFEVEAWARVR